MQIGRKGKLFVKKEATYNETPRPTLVATDAIRHIDVGMTWDPFARVTSPEKKQSPGAVVRLDRRSTGEFSLRSALLRPSGTLNTLPEADEILEAGFGSKTNVTLTTTVSASPAPTTTTATVASAGTLATGDGILITRAGIKYVRILTNVIANALTWAPALPTAPTTGESVKGCLTYKLTTDLAISLFAAHYLSATKRSESGIGIDKLSLIFDGTEEARLTASGPAAAQETDAVQAEPAAFTTVGGNPPTGMVGDHYIDAVAVLHKTLTVDLANGLALRHSEAGVAVPTEVYRVGRREVTIKEETFAEDETEIYDLAEAGTDVSVLRQNGRTEGNILALYLPRVEFKVPDQGDDDGEVSWSFSGLALESADGMNDELRLVMA